MNEPMMLRVFDVCRYGTHVLGPGKRYVVWTQGCYKHCKGCITPESRSIEGGILLSVNDIASDIILNHQIDGVTISGGEPFLQAPELIALLQLVKEYRPELTIIIYTGYVLEQLQQLSVNRDLLRLCDVLIDGEYEPRLDDNRGIRGSSNQRIIGITHRLDEYLEVMDKGSRRQELVAENNQLYSKIGVPRKIICKI